jgi:hypothetical protein
MGAAGTPAHATGRRGEKNPQVSFIKKHWLLLLAIPLAIVQPELIPVIGAAVVAKIIETYL